jgi:serine/threonine-protein kinase
MADILDRLKTALADRYTIERELGSGGMATVYLAEDLKHHRKVAIKVLRPELAASIGAGRFLREIRITANLNHPHILPLLDSGAAEGSLYYVMPLVEGESLRDRLNRELELPVDDAVKIALEVADALGYAHAHNVIHRDVKPENIMLEAGHAVVADFGIARAVSEAGGVRLTDTGIAIGTPAYLSPEQASGDQELDGRSDLYSLGCVLYEMLVGEPPFTGPNVQTVIAKKMSQTPADVTSIRDSVPAYVGQVVTTLLARTKVDRYATGAVLVEAIRSGEVGAKVQPADFRSVAVLPFANLSADPDNEYFSDGITEEIINALSRFPDLHVVARTSAFAFKGKSEDLRAVGDKLNVSKVLEGSVRREGDRLRITAQLVNVADGYHLWSERYDREVHDVFAIQDEIATAISDRLRVTLSDAAVSAVKPATSKVDAYDLYLRGRYEWSRRGQGLVKALESFQKALELDPAFALAHAGVGESYVLFAFYGMMRPKDAVPEAKRAAHRAMELDASLAAPHAVLAFASYLSDWDWNSAEYHFSKAHELEPHYLPALYWESGYRSLVAMNIGRSSIDAALESASKATKLDPLAWQPHLGAAWSYMASRRFDDAIRVVHDMIEVDGAASRDTDRRSLFIGHFVMASVFRWSGRYRESISAAHTAIHLSGGHQWTVADLGLSYAKAGRMKDAASLYNELVERSESEYVQQSILAPLAAAVGERDAALHHLERAVEDNDTHLIFAKTWPDYDPLRGDPRFDDVLRQMGLL